MPIIRCCCFVKFKTIVVIQYEHVREQGNQMMTPIEERIARLEQAVFGAKTEPSRDDWQKTVGMFRGDPVMKEILDDVREARQREREAACESNDNLQ